MCDCISKIKKNYDSDIKTKLSKPKKPVTWWDISATLSGKAIVPIKARLEGQIKFVDSFIVGEYCPFCGEKYA